MKLSFLEVSGFRGIRQPLRIQFPGGFTIIAGRNGTGKSTVCDAIEFALTGTIGRLSDKKERQESLANYIWWRGDEAYVPGSVKVAFVDEAGKEFVIERKGDRLTPESEPAIAELLGDTSELRDKAIRHLCHTSLIRSESIAELSLDLQEVDRFEMVKTAIGAVDFSEFETMFGDALKELDSAIRGIESRYLELRGKKVRLEAELSKARAEAEQSKDFEAAAQRLAIALGTEPSSLSQLISGAEQRIAQLRQRAAAISDAVPRLRSIYGQGTDGAADDKSVSEARLAWERSNELLAKAESELKKQDEEVKVERARLPRSNALRELVERGRQLSLKDGRCPLCGSAVEPDDFANHLTATEGQVRGDTERIVELTRVRDELQKQRDAAFVTNEQSGLRKRELEARIQSRSASLGLVVERMKSVAIELRGEPKEFANALDNQIGPLEREIAGLQNDVLVLASSSQVQKVAELEEALNICAKELADSDRLTMHASGTRARLKTALDAVRRFAGEIVDDRLASISPLLRELYARLRPHLGWTDIDYKIRGDVKRFLSLSVGGDLNPGFLFSSGQRRTAGLAFLLSINLARGWSKANFMVLDDPVQHVDDYRALHLVEVLASSRQLGRQVVCSMEDDELAELLCRRLRATRREGGSLVKLQYDPAAGITLKSQKIVEPLPENVFQVAVA